MTTITELSEIRYDTKYFDLEALDGKVVAFRDKPNGKIIGETKLIYNKEDDSLGAVVKINDGYELREVFGGGGFSVSLRKLLYESDVMEVVVTDDE